MRHVSTGELTTSGTVETRSAGKAPLATGQQNLRKLDYTAFIGQTALQTAYGGVDPLRGQVERYVR